MRRSEPSAFKRSPESFASRQKASERGFAKSETSQKLWSTVVRPDHGHGPCAPVHLHQLLGYGHDKPKQFAAARHATLRALHALAYENLGAQSQPRRSRDLS